MLTYIEMDKRWSLSFRNVQPIIIFLFSAKLDCEEHLQLHKALKGSVTSASSFTNTYIFTIKAFLYKEPHKHSTYMKKAHLTKCIIISSGSLSLTKQPPTFSIFLSHLCHAASKRSNRLIV